MTYNAFAFLTGSLILAGLSGPAAAQASGPPGMIRMRSATTTIGSSYDYVKECILEDESLLGPLSPEYDSHSVKVGEFYLMTTEVTNEQYAAYVKATQAAPPFSWADQEAVGKARLEFLTAEAKKPLADREKFEAADWWQRNWEGKPWDIPKGRHSHPVVWVDYQAARGYARWAGLRLMTEFEYQRACRGTTKNFYPWGEKFEPERLAYRESKGNVSFPVATFTGGTSKEGIHDLLGNAWEWTASPFSPYPKWKSKEISLGRGKSARKLHTSADWDPNLRVSVGGSFSSGARAVRCTTRRPTERDQSTDALGFRCAASPAPGADVASAILKQDFGSGGRPRGVIYDTEHAVAADRWTFEPGTAVTKVPGKGKDKDKLKEQPLENYAVITGYEYIMFLPVEIVDRESSVQNLLKSSLREGPVHFGVIASTVPMLQPALDPGSYLIAMRGAGADYVPEEDDAEGEGDAKGISSLMLNQEDEDVEAPGVEYPEGMDVEQNNFIFIDNSGKIVGFMPMGKMERGKKKAPTVVIGEGERTIEVTDEKGNVKKQKEACDEALMSLFVSTTGGRTSSYNFKLPLLFEKGSIDGKTWRLPKKK